MRDAITDVAGVEVGHAHDLDALTGCTVVLCRAGAVVGVDVRGAAPGTRETDLCRPGTLVSEAHGILLSGGSAFGLDAAAGVMRYLREAGIGLEVRRVRVPIVPGAVLFDLGIGRPVWPDAEMGHRACLAASSEGVAQGNVGAGTGATVGKLRGTAWAMKSGTGTASLRVGDVTLGALVAVNAFGDVVQPDTGAIIAGARRADGRFLGTQTALLGGGGGSPGAGEHTTIGVVATDATLNAERINHLALCAHDGLARCIQPVHTMADGDAIFGLATGRVPVEGTAMMLALAAGTVEVVVRAVVAAVRHAAAAGGLPAAGDVRD